jgi:hypothetical protein
VDGRCTSGHGNKTFRSRFVVKQKGKVFGFRKTATAVVGPDIYIYICTKTARLFHFLTDSLTDSMQQDLSWEASASEIGEKILLILRNLEVLLCPQEPDTCHCLAPDESSLFSPSCFFRVHFNIILPFTSRFSTLFHSFSFSHYTLYALLFFPTCATCPFHFIHFDSKIRIMFSTKYKL